MVTTAHEAPGQVVRDSPEVVAQLLDKAFGIKVPGECIIKNASEDFTQIVPAAYRADSAVEFIESASGKACFGTIIETQLRKDDDKLYSWPLYVAALRAKLRCPSVLVVICPERRVADWAARPIPTGHPGYDLTPLILGPGTGPLLTTTAEAADCPELAVLAAVARVTEPDEEALEITHAALATLENREDKRATLYHDLVLAALPKAAQEILEELVKTGTEEYKFKSDFALRHQAIGKASGEAEMVLELLDVRGFDVSRNVREQVLSCRDEEQLKAWLRQAATATSVDEVFG